MKLFSVVEEEKELVRGSGYSILRRKIDEAVNEDGFLFAVVIGERGKGKSTLALNVAHDVYGSIKHTLDSVVFTVDDYDSLVQSKRYRHLRAPDGRIKLVVWDDVGLHFSTYQWFTPHARQRMIEFVENFQTVREDVAVLIATVVEAEMLPTKMRSAANVIVDCYRRGRAKLFTYTRYLWFKTWKSVGEIEWSKCDEDMYRKYREMKRRAHRAKEKARALSRGKLLKVYRDIVEEMYAAGTLDAETLYGLGIVDKDLRPTAWGLLVLDERRIREVLEKEKEEGEWGWAL